MLSSPPPFCFDDVTIRCSDEEGEDPNLLLYLPVTPDIDPDEEQQQQTEQVRDVSDITEQVRTCTSVNWQRCAWIATETP